MFYVSHPFFLTPAFYVSDSRLTFSVILAFPVIIGGAILTSTNIETFYTLLSYGVSQRDGALELTISGFNNNGDVKLWKQRQTPVK